MRMSVDFNICISVNLSKNDIPFNYVERTLVYFPYIHETTVNGPNVLTLVQDEYIEYQSVIKNEIPERMRQEATLEGEQYPAGKRRPGDAP